MGQFKPMVKMMTTEPTVELKLKKGGTVKKADGGFMPMQSGMPSDMPARMPARGGMMPSARPAKPSMAMRRKAMAGRSMTPPMVSAPPMSATPAMKKGGKADMSQDKAMIKKAFKQHDAQEHKGGKGTSLKLKKGGMMKGGMSCATGGVAMGQGGYKNGGIISNEGKASTSTKMSTAKPDHSPAKTGDVKMGNGGGYKKGGTAHMYAKGGSVMNYVNGNVVGTPSGKTNTTTGSVTKSNAGGYKNGGKIKGMMGGGMAGDMMMNDGMQGGYKKGGASKKYARGGEVVQDDGKAVEMSQGRKKPSAPVSITALSGTFKKGGRVKKMAGGGDSSDYDPIYDREMARKGAEKASEREENEAMRDTILGAPRRLLKGVKQMFNGTPPSGSVTKTEKSVTVTPSKKRGGSVEC